MKKNERGVYRMRGELTSTAESWDEAVNYMLGPELVGDAPDRRQKTALELAAAALRAAGEHVMAANLLD